MLKPLAAVNFFINRYERIQIFDDSKSFSGKDLRLETCNKALALFLLLTLL